MSVSGTDNSFYYLLQIIGHQIQGFCNSACDVGLTYIAAHSKQMFHKLLQLCFFVKS